jgi:hypothetical protein
MCILNVLSLFVQAVDEFCLLNRVTHHHALHSLPEKF